jgi:hypothetical protein
VPAPSIWSAVHDTSGAKIARQAHLNAGIADQSIGRFDPKVLDTITSYIRDFHIFP